MDGRESFLDFRGKLRPDVKALKALWPSVTPAAFKTVLTAVVAYLEHPEKFTPETHGQLLRASAMEPEPLQKLFTGLLLVFRAGVRSRHKAPELKKDLEEELKMPTELAALLVTALQSRRGAVGEAALERRPRLSTIKSVDWRVEGGCFSLWIGLLSLFFSSWGFAQ